MLRKVEKYEIEEEIGHGGMATVYRAQDTVLDRAVALKILHPHLRSAEEARRRFQREARSVARLRHPRVLEIYDFSGEGSTEAFIAAELLTGPTLKQWREKTQDVPAEIAACFVIEIARALEAAHEAKIVHRDVKPENVLLHEDREIKLTDFGIADMVDSQSMTATGQILGSPGHMAPEQIEGKDTDERTDLFSLGTVLYYLATGRLPFTGRNPYQVLKRIVDSEYADPLRVNPAIGGRMRAIIVKSLAKEADDRYQSAVELREALEAFVAEAGILDPEATLARYLKNPDEERAKIVAQTVERLIDHGARASDAGDVPTALDYYNRVLVLDEGNEKVLKLIERVGMDRRRRRVMLAGAGLMAFGVLASGVAWTAWPGPGGRDPEPALPPVAIAPEDAGVDAGAELAALDDAGTPDAGVELAQAALDAGSADAVEEGVPSAPIRRAQVPAVSREPRVVALAPVPATVSIGIDGGPLRPYGGGFHSTELSPGRHTFRVVPTGDAAEVWAETTVTATVEPGEGPTRVPLVCPYKPATLFVRSVVPADVQVGTYARGRTNSLIAVPIGTRSANVLIRVTSDGHRAHEQRISLSAGERTVVAAELPELAAAP